MTPLISSASKMSKFPTIFLILIALVVLTSFGTSSHVLNHTATQFSIEKFMSKDTTSTLSMEAILPPRSLSNSSSVYTFPPYDRDVLAKGEHKTYQSILTARLARDEARMKFLSSGRVRTSVYNFGGQYVACMFVGSQKIRTGLLVDTGSFLTWLQCEPCDLCYSQINTICNSSKSSTFRGIKCPSEACKEIPLINSKCSEFECLYETHYADGSTSCGALAYETFTFILDEKSVDDVAFGCAHYNIMKYLPPKSHAAGVLGLGTGPYSLIEQMKASVFSFCVPGYTSGLPSTLEIYSSPPLGNSTITTPLIPNHYAPHLYFVSISGISIDGYMLEIHPSHWQIGPNGEGGVHVDSGLTISRFKPEIYSLFSDVFQQKMNESVKDMNVRLGPGTGIFDTCYIVPAISLSFRVPPVEYHFTNGVKLKLSPNHILVYFGNHKYCLAFAPSGDESSAIGNLQLQQTRLSFDLSAKQVSFSQNHCQ